MVSWRKKYKYIIETVRVFFFQFKLLVEYWGECILTFTYIINKFSFVPLNNKYSYELLYNKRSLCSHLRNFCCLCYLTTTKSQKIKF